MSEWSQTARTGERHTFWYPSWSKSFPRRKKFSHASIDSPGASDPPTVGIALSYPNDQCRVLTSNIIWCTHRVNPPPYYPYCNQDCNTSEEKRLRILRDRHDGDEGTEPHDFGRRHGDGPWYMYGRRLTYRRSSQSWEAMSFLSAWIECYYDPNRRGHNKYRHPHTGLEGHGIHKWMKDLAEHGKEHISCLSRSKQTTMQED